MSALNLFKLESTFAGARRELQKALLSGKVLEADDAGTVVQQLFDSLDRVELFLAFEESGRERLDLSGASVKDLIQLLEKLDAKYKSDHHA